MCKKGSCFNTAELVTVPLKTALLSITIRDTVCSLFIGAYCIMNYSLQEGEGVSIEQYLCT